MVPAATFERLLDDERAEPSDDSAQSHYMGGKRDNPELADFTTRGYSRGY